MKKIKHTPEPWYFGEQNDCLFIINKPPPPCTGRNTCADIPDVKVIARVGETTQDEANAQFIVKACNSHYELLEALEFVFNTPGNSISKEGYSKGYAAIAKAKGE